MLYRIGIMGGGMFKPFDMYTQLSTLCVLVTEEDKR